MIANAQIAHFQYVHVAVYDPIASCVDLHFASHGSPVNSPYAAGRVACDLPAAAWYFLLFCVSFCARRAQKRNTK
jgi:hypothetical protein